MDAKHKLFAFGAAAGLAGAIGVAFLMSTLVSSGSAQMMGGYPNMMDRVQQYPPPTAAQTQYGVGGWGGWPGYYSASGISEVAQVQIVGVSVTGDHEVTVDLKYTGSPASGAPSVAVVAASDLYAMPYGLSMPMPMMYGGAVTPSMYPWPGMMSANGGGYGYGPMMYGSYFGYNSTAWEQMQAIHGQTAGGVFQGYGGMMASPWNSAATGNSSNSTNGGGLHPPLGAYSSQLGTAVLQSGWQPIATVKVRLQADYPSASAYDSHGIHIMVFPLTS